MPILYYGHWTGNHYCTNSLSSLHISSRHCTFCASLHAKTSPSQFLPFRSIIGKNIIELDRDVSQGFVTHLQYRLQRAYEKRTDQINHVFPLSIWRKPRSG